MHRPRSQRPSRIPSGPAARIKVTAAAPSDAWPRQRADPTAEPERPEDLVADPGSEEPVLGTAAARMGGGHRTTATTTCHLALEIRSPAVGPSTVSRASTGVGEGRLPWRSGGLMAVGCRTTCGVVWSPPASTTAAYSYHLVCQDEEFAAWCCATARAGCRNRVALRGATSAARVGGQRCCPRCSRWLRSRSARRAVRSAVPFVSWR